MRKRKMKLKTVKIIAYALYAITILLILAVVETKQRIYGVGAAIACIGAGIVETALYKCPECGKFLGSLSNQCCPNCGYKLKEEKNKEDEKEE